MSSPPILMSMVQAAPSGQGGGTAGLCLGILPWLLIFVIFYMLMIRPQQQRVKEHQAAIAAVKKGDEVITGGGIRGRVTKVCDDEAEVEIASGVKIRVVKSTISHVLSTEHEAGQRLMLEFPRWKVWLVSLVVALGVLLFDSEPDRRHHACRQAGRSGSRNTASASASTLPAAATCCSRRTSAMRRSSGSRRWRIRSRPSFAAIRESTSATFRPPAGGLSFLVRDPTQVDAAVERMRTLTQPQSR